MEKTLNMFSSAPHVHCLHDHKPTVQRVMTERDYYTINGEYQFSRLDSAEQCQKNSRFEIQDLKETVLPQLFNVDTPPLRSFKEYTVMASEMLGESSKALTYAFKHLPLTLLHSGLRTVHYANEQETPLGIMLSRLISFDAAVIIGEELSQLASEDPEFYWNMLRFVSIRYMHIITELGIEKERFFINPHDYGSMAVHSMGTNEITEIMKAYRDKTLVMNVPARAPHEPLYTVHDKPEPFYEPLLAEYLVVRADSPIPAEEFVLERHTVEEEQYLIQSKIDFRDVEQYSSPEAVLDDIKTVYEGLVRQEKYFAKSLGFPDILSALQNEKMGYLLKHYSIQEVLELDFAEVYHDPFEEVFDEDAGTFMYTAHRQPDYPLFKQFEMYRKHQYYMKLIDEIQSTADDDGTPVLPLNLALHLSYSEELEEGLVKQLEIISKKSKSMMK